MTREEELKKHINNYILDNINNDKSGALEVISYNTEKIVTDVLRVFDEVFKKCIKLQNENKKKDVAYISISYLNMGIINEELEVQINIYDENFMLDKDEIVQAYKIDFLSNYLRNDLDGFSTYIKSKMIRVKYQELYEYKKVAMVKYKSILEQYFISFIPLIIRLRTFVDMKKEKNFKITFGEYMCESVILYNEEEEVI